MISSSSRLVRQLRKRITGKSAPSAATPRRLQFEGLERRDLMAAAVGNFDTSYLYSLEVGTTICSSDRTCIRADDSDIVKLSVDGRGGYKHELFFDGSRYGLTRASEDIDAFAIHPNGNYLISTTDRVSVPGVRGDGADVLQFNPSTKRWSMYFDASKAWISNYEGIDAVDILPDGRMVVSLNQAGSVRGLSRVEDEDLIVWNRSSKRFQMYFDGSDVGLADAPNKNWEDVEAVAVRPTSLDGSHVSLEFAMNYKFSVPGVSGRYEDAVRFTPTSLGNRTSGKWGPGLEIDGSRIGLKYRHLDALFASYGDKAGVVRGNNWLFDLDGDDSCAEASRKYGKSSDIKLAGDFNGNGQDTMAVVRKSGSYLKWYIDDNGDRRADRAVYFGLASDTPLVGDINGDGKDDLIVTRANHPYPGALSWFFNTTGKHHAVNSGYTLKYGLAGDTPLIGDFNGDGRDDATVVRRNSSGGLTWYVNTTRRDDRVSFTRNYGLWGDSVIVGDWNGDGKDDMAAVRASGRYLVWYYDLDGRGGSAESSLLYGLVGDTIVAGHWTPQHPQK